MLPQLRLITEREEAKQARLMAGHDRSNAGDEAVDFLARGVAGAAGAYKAIASVAESLHYGRGVEISVRNEDPLLHQRDRDFPGGDAAYSERDGGRSWLVWRGPVELHSLDLR